MRFDEHSFIDEITNKTEAQNCFHYFLQNLGEAQQELIAAGASYGTLSTYLRTVWGNLITSCERVGYTNSHLEAAKKALAEDHAEENG